MAIVTNSLTEYKKQATASSWSGGASSPEANFSVVAPAQVPAQQTNILDQYKITNDWSQEFRAIIDSFVKTVSSGYNYIFTNGYVSVQNALLLKRTSVSSSPYTVLSTDIYLSVDCSGGAKTINLPAVATAGDGRVIVVKDASGDAAANNITITPNGAETIDEQANAILIANYVAINLMANTTTSNWEIW